MMLSIHYPFVAALVVQHFCTTNLQKVAISGVCAFVCENACALYFLVVLFFSCYFGSYVRTIRILHWFGLL